MHYASTENLDSGSSKTNARCPKRKGVPQVRGRIAQQKKRNKQTNHCLF